MRKRLNLLAALLVAAGACEKPVDRLLRLQSDSLALSARVDYANYRVDSLRLAISQLPAGTSRHQRDSLDRAQTDVFMQAMAVYDSLKRVNAELRLTASGH